MKLGIGSYTFAWAIGVPGHAVTAPLDAFGLLREAARLGVQVVQFCENLPLDKLSAEELQRFEHLADTLGIAVELGTRGLAPANLRAYLALAQRFGCSFVRLVIDQGHDEPSFGETITRLRPVLPEFAAAGVRLAIENHDRFRAVELAALVSELGRGQTGICLDTVNSLGALEGPQIVVETLGPLALCLHVKDFTMKRVSHQMGFVVEGCAAGTGCLDVPWLLRNLSSNPHPFNVILESWVSPAATLAETIQRERAWADQGIRYLRQYIRN